MFNPNLQNQLAYTHVPGGKFLILAADSAPLAWSILRSQLYYCHVIYTNADLLRRRLSLLSKIVCTSSIVYVAIIFVYQFSVWNIFFMIY
jgi:hypothetical protein